jgi:hypothetical protein
MVHQYTSNGNLEHVNLVQRLETLLTEKLNLIFIQTGFREYHSGSQLFNVITINGIHEIILDLNCPHATLQELIYG